MINNNKKPIKNFIKLEIKSEKIEDQLALK